MPRCQPRWSSPPRGCLASSPQALMCVPGSFSTNCIPFNDMPCCALPALHCHRVSAEPCLCPIHACSKLVQAGLLTRLPSLQGNRL